MRKTLMIVLALLLAALALPGAAAAEESPANSYTLVVEDRANLLSESEIAWLREAMEPVTAYANVGFLTWPSGRSNGRSAATKAQEWGDSVFGPRTRFTVFIIDMSTRHLDIYASRPLAGVLTAAEENSIADNVYRYATQGDYARCAEETFRQIERVLRGEKIATPMKYISNALLALIVAILATYLLISAMARKEQKVSAPDAVRVIGAGAATVIMGKTLKRVVRHQSGSGGRGFGGGGGGGGGGGSSGGHGF